MRPSSATTTTAVLLLTYLLSPLCLALTIVSPFTGTTVDPSEPLTIIWTSSSADPTTITFKLEKSDSSNTLASNQVLASNVPSRQGSVIVPAYTIEAFGTGYEIVALSPSGQQVAVSGSLVMADSSSSVTTLSGGALSFVSSESTKSTTTDSTAKSATKTTTTTASAAPPASTDSVGAGATSTGFTVFTGTATAITGSTTGALSAPTHSTQPTGFVTSSTTRAGSASASASAATSSAAANTNTANRLGVTGLAFPGMGRGEVVMGAAGVLAGVVALIV